jgi:hypothetical protein
MIVRTTQARSLHANRRIDCKYFLSPGTQAAERLAVVAAAGVPLRCIGGSDGLGHVWAPARFKRAYAAPGEDAIPYLRPYDIFDYVPQAADLLSIVRSDNIAQLKAPAGALLQTCSGRNLGPAVAVDAHLERFALSHDLIRVEIDDETDRYYTLAFLATPTGHALVRRDKTGSVIDHISVGHLAEVAVPFLDNAIRTDVAQHMRQAVQLRSDARAALASAVTQFAASLPVVERAEPTKGGWSVAASRVGARVDAAYHDPLVAELRGALLAAGGQRLSDVAEVLKPSGRYKTFYVGPDHGLPLLSGRQLLQYRPVNLRHISVRSLDPKRYQLKHQWIAMQADGRSEERLGVPVVIESDRAGWLASGHVARVIPRDGIHPGWLYAAVATDHVQAQVKALACGSVVDAIYEPDLEQIILPAPGGINSDEITAAWEQFAQATHAEANAIQRIEDELAVLTGEVQLSA